MKIKSIALVASIAATVVAPATVTLQINSQGFVGGAANDVLAGLTWGIVVDRSDNGFQAWDGPLNVSSGTLFGADDELWLSTFTSLNAGIGGLLTNVANVPDGAGLDFGVIWFQDGTGTGDTADAGDSYGFLTDPSFQLPANGATQAYPVAAEVRTQDQAFAGVPEPSVALLGALGVLGLVRRRR